MRIEAKRSLDIDELTWGSEPNTRAEVKTDIAYEIARKLRTRDEIDWSWRVNDDGKLEVVGSISTSRDAERLRAALRRVVEMNKSLRNDPEIKSLLGDN